MIQYNETGTPSQLHTPIVIEIFRVLNLVMTPAWKAEMPAIIAATELVIDICEEMN